MLVALALVGLSLLGTSVADCGDGSVITVGYNQEGAIEAQDLENCGIIHGDIVIDPAYVYFTVDGVEEITGTLTAHDNNILKYTSMADLRRLGGLSIKSPRIQPRVSLPALEEIGRVEWLDFTWEYFEGFAWELNITALSGLTVENTLLWSIRADRAGFWHFDGFDVLETADDVRIARNGLMGQVELPALKTVTESIEIGDNGNEGRLTGRSEEDDEGKRGVRDYKVVSLPQLASAGSIHIYNEQDGKVDLPTLTEVHGDLKFTDNEVLYDISAPQLASIDGSLTIENTVATSALSFPSLKRVAGDVFLDSGAEDYPYGDTGFYGFESASFPELEEVGGSFYLRTPSHTFDCSELENVRALVSEFTCITAGDRTYSGPSSSSTPLPGTFPTPTDGDDDEPGNSDPL